MEAGRHFILFQVVAAVAHLKRTLIVAKLMPARKPPENSCAES